jgi:hypothetical protein
MAIPSGAGFDLATPQAPSSDIDDFSYIDDLSRHSVDYWSDNDTADGTRVRVAKNDDETELASDPIDFDNGAETGLLRIFIGSVSAASTAASRAIRVYSPNTRNTAYAPSDTYGSDNAYAAIWDAYYPDGGATDRTSNGRDGSSVGSPTTVSGHLGDATDYNLNDRYDMGDTWLDGYGEMSALAYYNPDTIDSTNRQVLGSWESTLQFQIRTRSGQIRVLSFSGDQYREAQGGTITAGNWFHIGITLNQSAPVRAWVDGVNVASTAAHGSTATMGASTDDFSLGNNEALSADYVGLLQHVGIFNEELLGPWINEEFEQIDDQATFWGTWAWTSPSGGSIVPVLMYNYRQRRIA